METGWLSSASWPSSPFALLWLSLSSAAAAASMRPGLLEAEAVPAAAAGTGLTDPDAVVASTLVLDDGSTIEVGTTVSISCTDASATAVLAHEAGGASGDLTSDAPALATSAAMTSDAMLPLPVPPVLPVTSDAGDGAASSSETVVAVLDSDVEAEDACSIVTG